MKEAFIVLQCNNEEQIQTLRFTLHCLGYVWGGSKLSLIDYTPFSLKKHKGKFTNIIILPHEKSVRYNFSQYEGLGNSDGINYVIEVY